MVVVAERQGLQGSADGFGRRAGLLGEAYQRGLMRQDELQHARQETRLARRAADRACLDAGDRKEANLYIRVAFGDAATPKLETEALRYESFPQYAAHFERMGVRAIDTTVFGPTEAAIQAGLAAYDGVVDELVARAIVADETAPAYLELARAAAPNRR